MTETWTSTMRVCRGEGALLPGVANLLVYYLEGDECVLTYYYCVLTVSKNK